MYCTAPGKEGSGDNNSEVEPSVPSRPVPSPTAFTTPTTHANIQRVQISSIHTVPAGHNRSYSIYVFFLTEPHFLHKDTDENRDLSSGTLIKRFLPYDYNALCILYAHDMCILYAQSIIVMCTWLLCCTLYFTFSAIRRLDLVGTASSVEVREAYKMTFD